MMLNMHGKPLATPSIHWLRWLLLSSFILLASGCALIDDQGQTIVNASRRFDQLVQRESRSPESDSGKSEVRFDGQETLLGTHQLSQLSANAFLDQLQSNLKQQKLRSAADFVMSHLDTAAAVLWSRWADEPDRRELRFVAQALSRHGVSTGSWTALLDHTRNHPEAAQAYQVARQRFQADSPHTASPSTPAEALRNAAQQLGHPLATMDALQLMAVRELNAERFDWSESLLLQAIELAETHQDDFRVADLFLLRARVANHAQKSAPLQTQLWQSAVQRHALAHSERPSPVRSSFWLKAIQAKPANADWPAVVGTVFNAAAAALGCPPTNRASVEFSLWCAIATVQLQSGDAQMALIHFKKAEILASPGDQQWLRIAQAECLASLGQSQTASALLGGPLASENIRIAAAANASLGSAKLQDGAFQQGARLLHQALKDPTIDWPKRTHAEADLALAQLIIGDSEQGRRALHAAQRKFELRNDIRALLQALENERRLLQHEQQHDALKKTVRRIADLESRPFAPHNVTSVAIP